LKYTSIEVGGRLKWQQKMKIKSNTSRQQLLVAIIINKYKVITLK